MQDLYDSLKRPYHKRDVRAEYWDGRWAYARGRAAWEHPRYAAAVETARRLRQGRKFNPWWLRTWSDVEAVEAGCWFDPEAGVRPVQFVEQCLRHTKHGLGEGEQAGRPIVLMDWQRWDILYPLFGWRRADGTRRFRRASIWVPKKNGKSYLSSAIGLYLLTKDAEAAPEVFCAAGSRQQAGIVHDESARMVRMSPLLRPRLQIIDSRKTITYPPVSGRFLALSSEAGLQEGLNWSGLIFDEVHTQTDPVYFETLYYGGIARRQPLMIEISTAGIYAPLSIGWNEYEVAQRVHEGAVSNPWLFTYIAHVPEGEDWSSEEWLVRANPGSGVTFRVEELMDDARDALENPRAQNRFRRYRANQWTHSATRWMPARDWDACRADYDLASLEGQLCYAGLDLSLSDDITALVLCWPPHGTVEQYSLWEWYFLPQDVIEERERSSRAPYRDWARQGYMELTPGNTVDYGYVRQVIEDCCRRFDLRTVLYDPYNANETSIALRQEHGEEFAVEHRQGMLSMAPPTRQFEELIRTQRVRHRGNPITAWHVSNAQAIYDSAGNYRITKGEVGTQKRARVRHKVDGVIAAIMAVGRAVADEPSGSYYDKAGIGVVDLGPKSEQTDTTEADLADAARWFEEV